MAGVAGCVPSGVRLQVATALLLVVLSGCASQPTDDTAPQGAKGAGGQLYAGEPVVVHSNQSPLASAAEGIQRGDQAWREGKLDLAVYLYVESIAFDATAAEPFLKIGAIHEQRGNWALAQKAYELALERQPGNAGACERLGLLYLQADRNDDARALFDRAIALEANRWRSHNGLGIVADRRQDFATAITHYDRALAIEPRAASALNNRGYSRFLAGDLPGAEADLRQAIRVGARDGDGAWTNLGRVQAAQARYAEALESFLHDVKMPHAYNLLGEAAMQRGDLVQAKRYFESAIGESPTYFDTAQKNLAVVNERLATEDPAVAGAPTTLVAVADTKVYFDGSAVGIVRRGDRVVVLESKQGRSRVRFRDAAAGADRVGWMPSEALAERQ